MKRYLLVLIALFSTFPAFSQSEKAIYIYRNDGDFNAFLYEDIDSLVHSNIGLDSVRYNYDVVQEVWTQDSIYRIPLSVIDSVSFIQPETIFQPNVVQMEKMGLMDYLQGVDGMSLLFRTTIPRELQPQVGEVLLSTDFDSILLENGFAGKVQNTQLTGEAFRVDCDSIYDIFEIFEQLISIEKIVADEGASSRRRVDGEWFSNRNTLKFELGYSHSLSEKEKVSLSGSVGGAYIATVTYNITRKEQYIKLKIDHDWQYGAHLNFKKELGSFGTLKGPVASLPAIRFAHVFKFQITGCPFVKGEGNMELDFSLNSPAHSYVGEAVYRNGHFSGWNHPKTVQGSNTPNVEAAFSLNGSVQAGYMVDLWLGLDTSIKGFAKDLLKVGTGLDFYIGPKLSGDFSMKVDSENPVNYYSIYKDSKIGIDWLHVDYEFFGEASLAGHKFPKAMFCNGSLQSPLNHEWYIMPEFSDLSVAKDREKKQATISTTPSRDILFPLSVGMGLYDSDDKLLSTKYESKNYKRENEGYDIEQTFSSLEIGKKYTAKPFIKFLGGEIPALPEDTFKLGLPEIKEFRVTRSRYSKGAYYNEGQYYDYRFDAATTVEIESLEGVADWGYVYKDTNKNIKHISLMQFGSSYTDTRYAYFRNAPQSSCSLYSYVKYVDSDNIVYGEPNDYPLIYNNEINVYTEGASPSYTEAQCWGNASFCDNSNDPINTVVDECGFFFNLTGSPRNGNATKQSSIMDATGSYNAMLSCLEENTLYYYAAFIKVGNNYYFGETQTFRTKKKDNPDPDDPIAITGTNYNVKATTATIECIYKNVPSGADCGYFIDENTSSTSGSISINRPLGAIEGTQVIPLLGLKPNTKYYYQAYIKNNGLSYYGVEKSFITLTPIAITGGYSDVTINSAVVECSFENVPEGGRCYVFLQWEENGDYKMISYNVSSENNCRITCSGLKPYTTYFYTAAISYNGKEYLGKEKSFTTKGMGGCPDDHHPHAIDLGLPSGTKWCCCNVGASTPDEYGGYYAWGETVERSAYNEVTYSYFIGEDIDCIGVNYYTYRDRHVIDIGSDIAGTSYDVAHVLMGTPWRMPSAEQLQELIDNCHYYHYSWSSIEVIGPNGGVIYLPLAGERYLDSLISKDGGAYYWSSTHGKIPEESYHMRCNPGWDEWYVDDHLGWRCFGNSVRAVCP